MGMIIKVLASVFFVLAATAVQAAETGIYGGFGLGLGQVSSSGNINGISSKLGLGVGLKGGYRLNKFVSVEGEFSSDGQGTSNSSTSSQASARAMTANVLLFYPMADNQKISNSGPIVSTKYAGYNDAAWYVLAGYGQLKTTVKNSFGVEILNASKNGMKLGFGVEVGHTSDLAARLGIETYDTSYVRVTKLEFSVIKKF